MRCRNRSPTGLNNRKPTRAIAARLGDQMIALVAVGRGVSAVNPYGTSQAFLNSEHFQGDPSG